MGSRILLRPHPWQLLPGYHLQAIAPLQYTIKLSLCNPIPRLTFHALVDDQAANGSGAHRYRGRS